MGYVTPQDSTPAEGTALALVEAATELFGKKGYAATSTREVAALAGTNVASIAYHFGGKEGLRQACGIEFVRKLDRTLASVDQPDNPTPDSAEAAIHATIRAIAPLMIGSTQGQAMVSFVLRELFETGPTAELIYARFVEPAHLRFCRLWAIATQQDPNDATLKLRVFSVIGQILYFRVASPFVMSRMGWTALDGAEVNEITEVLIENIAALIATERRT